MTTYTANNPLRPCDVCKGHEEEGLVVCSSSVGPISFGFCRRCLANNAEPESMLSYLYWFVGTKGEGLDPSIRTLRTWKNGKYWTWGEYCEWAKDQPDPNDTLREAEEAERMAYWEERGIDPDE